MGETRFPAEFQPSQAAYNSFRGSVRRYLGLPRSLRAPVLPLRAVLWQRRSAEGTSAGREILNEAQVLAAMRNAGFAIDGALEPHRLPLLELVRLLGGTKLLVSMHGGAASGHASM